MNKKIQRKMTVYAMPGVGKGNTWIKRYTLNIYISNVDFLSLRTQVK